MDLDSHIKSIAELKKDKRILQYIILACSIALAFLAIKLAFKSEIIIQQTPGMPNDTVIQKSTMDKRAQMATLYTVTNNLSQVNPANAEYIKSFIQVYLAPAAYTRISKDIDSRVATLVAQRELGSYYSIMRDYHYDSLIDRHFIRCDVHVVNAARDSATPYVFEYTTHIENYRIVVDDVKTYEGDRVHNSEWIRNNVKKS